MNGWSGKYDPSAMVYSRPPSQSDVLPGLMRTVTSVLDTTTDFAFDN